MRSHSGTYGLLLRAQQHLEMKADRHRQEQQACKKRVMRIVLMPKLPAALHEIAGAVEVHPSTSWAIGCMLDAASPFSACQVACEPIFGPALPD